MTATVTLEPRLTVEAAGALWARLRGQTGAEIDASGVRHLGAAAVQVLLVASHEMQAAGGQLRLIAPSEAMRAALDDMGAGALMQEGGA